MKRKVIADFEHGRFPIRVEITDKLNGYDAVSEILEKWYQAMNYGGEMDFVVSLKGEWDVHGDTVQVTRTKAGDYEWKYDWWEGNEKYDVLGFCPICWAYLEIKGCPEIIEE